MDIETFWRPLYAWFLDHGWRILLIMIIAGAARRFSMLFLSRLIHHSVESAERTGNKRDRKLRANTLLSLVGSILKIANFIIIGLLVLSELNVLTVLAPLLAGAGVLSLLLGFGIQTFVKDFISGVFIVAENQYRVGDVVEVSAAGGEVRGMVVRITLRTTVIRDNDGAIHFIPNGNISRAANQTLDFAKVNIELPLPLSVDFETVEQQINQLGLSMHREPAWQRSLIQAPYYHGVQSLEEDKAVIEIRARTLPAEQWRVSSELQKRLALLLREDSFNTAAPAKKKAASKKKS